MSTPKEGKTQAWLAAQMGQAAGRLAELDAGLRKIQEVQPQALEMMRTNGFIFETSLTKADLTEAERWEKLAFSLYTKLCEVEAIARALREDDQAEDFSKNWTDYSFEWAAEDFPEGVKSKAQTPAEGA